MWAVILTNRGISAEVPNCILWDMDFFLLLPASDMPLLWKSLFDMRNILHEGPHEKARPICRQENGSLHDPPMETSFGHWNMSLLLQDKNLIIGRICAGNPNIRFLRCLPNRDVISSLNPPNSHDPNGGTYVQIGGVLKEK